MGSLAEAPTSVPDGLRSNLRASRPRDVEDRFLRGEDHKEETEERDDLEERVERLLGELCKVTGPSSMSASNSSPPSTSSSVPCGGVCTTTSVSSSVASDLQQSYSIGYRT